MRGRTHRRERVKEGFENAGLAQPVEAFHTLSKGRSDLAGRATERLNRKEMERLEEAPIILGLPSSRRQGQNTASVCAQSSSSIFVDMRSSLQSVGDL